jgi:hypothetical protein
MQSHFLHWVALLQIFYSFDCEPMPALVLNFHTALQLFGAVRNGKLRYPDVNQRTLMNRFPMPRRLVLNRGVLALSQPQNQSTN